MSVRSIKPAPKIVACFLNHDAERRARLFVLIYFTSPQLRSADPILNIFDVTLQLNLPKIFVYRYEVR
jgi:hypothetical protein